MTGKFALWRDAQSADVRAELDNLLAYQPELEFTEGLVSLLSVVPCPGLIDLYYDLFIAASRHSKSLSGSCTIPTSYRNFFCWPSVRWSIKRISMRSGVLVGRS